MKFRKFAAVLAAASMLTVFSAQVASAADSVTVTAEKVTAAAGSEFALKVDLSGIPSAGVNAADFSLTYDASIITITGVSAGDIVNTAADGVENFADVSIFEADYSTAGTITVTYGVALDDSAYWATKDGTLLTIKGTVNADAAPGAVSEVKIVANDRETYDGSGVKNADIYIGNMNADGAVTNYDVTASNGSVTVADGDVPDPSGVKKGDVNLDGEIDIMDVILLNKALFGKVDLSDPQIVNADINNDSTPDSTDCLNIMKYIIKLIDSLDNV